MAASAQPLLASATRAEQREAIIADLNSDAAVDTYVAYVRESTPARKALRLSTLIVGAASLLFIGAFGGFGYAKVKDEPDMPLECSGDAIESQITIEESCRRIEEFAGGAGARRRLTAVKSSYSCLPHYRLPITGTDGKVTFPYHASANLAYGGSHTLALIVMHGAMRDADNYFCMMHSLMAAQPYRDPNDIVVIAPDFNYGNDEGVAVTDAFWNTSKPWGDWRAGAMSSPLSGGGRIVSAYEVMDTVIMMLNDTAFWPRLNEIAIVGHSAGGQFVQRWALMTSLPPKISPRLDVRYVIANPSSFAYFDSRRLKYTCGECDCNPRECNCNGACTNEQNQLHGGQGIFETVPKGFEITDAKGFVCGNRRYDNWPYGLKARWGYTAARDMTEALGQYAERDVFYLNGQNDTCNDGLPFCNDDCWQKDNQESPCMRNHMDTRCPAMLQGPWRKARGMQYMQYLKDFYGKKVHNFKLVPGAGHNATAVFFSPVALTNIFHLNKSTMSAFDSAADEIAMRLISQPPRYPNIMAKLALEPEEDEGEAYEYAEM